MRHRNARNKLGRDSSHRRAMMRNMTTSLFRHEQLETTDAKAKELRPVAEKMITLAKRGGLHARRQALAYLQDKGVTHRLFGELRDRYLDRQGGYIRIVKKGTRRGDGASVSIIQLLSEEKGKKGSKSSAAKGAPSGRGKKQGEAKTEKKAAERSEQQGRSGESVDRGEERAAKGSD